MKVFNLRNINTGKRRNVQDFPARQESARGGDVEIMSEMIRTYEE